MSYNQSRKYRNILKSCTIIVFLIAQLLFSQGIEWQREYEAVVNGDTLPSAYLGGINFSKPAFVDIDADGNFDMFTGDEANLINLQWVPQLFCVQS